ncbi:putative zinc-binding dehydrogenase family oxidoreductase [Aspergillus terreus]|uniref:Putative zinc-binding dehydrogenase family oxidoreductase n=1 Tax=Aspergillus terreus TaxID=33178 RepID=A0A5M3Z7L4_ASPTE|nr:hypothetical protein ATETN484_0009007100 [Aspergillus terreus]GFF17522.1 putative zinc-binding dehydrogenase family oxidoreductase [Aspergillus terreus]
MGDRISFKVLASVSHAEESTIPLACATAWLVLFSKECLHLDRVKDKRISVPSWAAVVRASSFSPIPHADLVLLYGAKHLFDYKDVNIVEKIKQAAPYLQHIFDAVGNPTSSIPASHTLRSGGTLCTVRPGKDHTDNVAAGARVTDVLVWTAFLENHSYGFSKRARTLRRTLRGVRVVRSSHPKIYHGPDAAPEGLQKDQDGKISVYKIVYEL